MAAQTVSPSADTVPAGRSLARWLTPLRGIDPLRAMGTIPALFIASWILVAFPALLLGLFYPVPVTVVALIPTVLLVRWCAPTMRARPGEGTPWWSAAAVAAIAVAVAVFAIAEHSSQLLITRDAGSYAQIGYWFGHNHSLPIQTDAAAFGSHPGVIGFDSAAFYPHTGSSVLPQFMTGWLLLVGLAANIGGLTGVFAIGGILGGCALLSLGALVGRLAGPRWAPLGALLGAVVFPVMHVFEGPYSEPSSLLLLTTGLLLLSRLVDPAAVDVPAWALRRAAFAAGLTIGISQLVRLDAGAEIALLLPVAGWWFVTRRPGAFSLLAGLALGFGLGGVDMIGDTRPYVAGNKLSVEEMVAALVALGVASAAVSLLARLRGWDRGLPRWLSRLLAPVGAAGVLLVALVLLLRPYFEISHSVTNLGVQSLIETEQTDLHLPVDGTRSYAEQSLRWVSWYLGWPMLALVLVSAIAVTWLMLRDRERRWLPVLPVYLGSTVLTLLNPGITPDHPWADRRLVVVVFPCMIVLAVWGLARVVPFVCAYAARHLKLERIQRPAVYAASALCALGCVLPAAHATFPLATERTEQGEPQAVATVCSTLYPDDSVISIEKNSWWLPVIRGECGVPVAYLEHATRATLANAVSSIKATGRVPVIISSSHGSLIAIGVASTCPVRLRTHEDAHQLLHRPTRVGDLTATYCFARR